MLNCECGAELIQEDCETILDVCQEAPVVKDYETLANKPQINGVTLDGNKTSEDLGITQEIADAVIAEATLRENADTALGGRIDNEATARENADTALGGRIDGEITNRTNADNALGTRIDNEILARQGGDNNLQTQIDAITSKSDVVDVVADYAALQAYDTQQLGNNDVIKVLDDETHDDAQTYYRWNKTAGTWSYIGSEAPYYSKGQMDTMLQAKQDKLIAGTNIQIAQDGKTISATDTTYTAGNGLNLDGTEFRADTTVLATKSDLDNYYTKTETDTKLAPKLEAEVVAELPSTGTEGKLYLTPKNYTTGTATGNPITISLGEDAGQITSFQLDGDTYQQSFTGKNLFAQFSKLKRAVDAGTATVTVYNGTSYTLTEESLTLVATNTDCSIRIDGNQPMSFQAKDYGTPCSGSTEYTLSYTASAANQYFIRTFNSEGEQLQNISSQTMPSGDVSYTFTTNANATVICLRLDNEAVSEGGTTCSFSKVQLELGSTATTYEPFVGGVPSPNPDYPQPIQTVTGTQTITINGTDYPISLGSIELCKLGTYQDYIYKDGDDWKVHKSTKAIYLKDITWLAAPTSVSGKYRMRTSTAPDDILAPADNNTKAAIKSSVYSVITAGDTYSASATGISVQATTPHIFIYDPDYNTASSPTAFTKKMASTNATAYYALATATDTTITDQTLIAQLEAIRTVALETGANTITNTATGSNLAGDMELGYYEFDPTNRYDKWLWLDLNNNYEKLGS